MAATSGPRVSGVPGAGRYLREDLLTRRLEQLSAFYAGVDAGGSQSPLFASGLQLEELLPCMSNDSLDLPERLVDQHHEDRLGGLCRRRYGTHVPRMR